MDVVSEIHTRPRQVVVAVWLLAASLIVGIPDLVLQFSKMLHGSMFALFDAVGGESIYLGILIWLITKIFAGRNWARIVFLIYVSLSILLLLITLPSLQGPNVVHQITRVAQNALEVISMGLLFFGAGRLWFKRPKILA